MVRYQFVTRLFAACLLCLPSAVVLAEVTDSDQSGFTVHLELDVAAPPQEVYRHLVQNIGKWWESSHTYSGDAANLYLEAAPKGWFGERLPDGGSVQHLEVIHVRPNQLLRLRGALGPMQEYAITGALTWRLTESTSPTSATQTKLSLTYSVGGYRQGGLVAFARPVNSVLETQAQRLKRYVETGKPD